MNFSEVLDKHSIFNVVAQCAKDLGVDAYVIGGYVRDLMLKRPSKDIDIVSIGSGIELAEAVAKKLGVYVNVFKNFGTAQFRVDDLDVEFVGARRESYRTESRKPIVEDGTLQDDQNRRDFTINAMGISLNAQNYGDLIDPFNGISDLRKNSSEHRWMLKLLFLTTHCA